MVTAKRDPALIVIQLAGGNDAMNTIVPYTNGIYHDSRKAIGLTESDVLDINGTLGFHPSMGPIKDLWDRGNAAIVQGIGYPVPNRSHFRSMDIWHTAVPTEVGNEGWLGQATRMLDPNGDNPVTAVNFGHGLPRALASPGVPTATERRTIAARWPS